MNLKKISLLLLLFISGRIVALETGISIGERVSISSAILDEERTLLIYTPASYGFNEASKYPVLYIVDADYNFHYVTGLIELLSSISAYIPEMLVVGISGKGTQAYRKASKPPYKVEDSGKADETISFIENDVIPYINTNYKTADYKVLSGHSIGGLFSTYAMLNKPKLFDAYIAISPSLWWQDQAVSSETEKMFDQRRQVPANYYITLANEQGMGVHGFVELLQSKGPRSLQVHFKHFPEETHGSVGLPSYRWALQKIFDGFRLKDRYFKNAQSIKDHHQLFMDRFGQTLPIASGYLRNTLYAAGEDLQLVLSVEQAIEEYFPAQLDQFRNLQVESLLAAGKIQEAEVILNRAIKNDAQNFETLTNQSRIYLKQNKKRKALKAIDQAIKIANKKGIRQWLMNELYEQKSLIN